MDVKKRTPIVDYAIGMILRHSPTRLLCVVCGWDIGKLHVWYHVLCEDNMMYFYTEGSYIFFFLHFIINYFFIFVV